MMIKASGRSALVLATGLFVCFAGPSQAVAAPDEAAASSNAETTAGAPMALKKYTKQSSRSSKKYANHKSSKEASKSSAAKKAETDDVAASDNVNSSGISPSVANANAQLASADNSVGNAKAMSARATTIVQAAADTPSDTQPAGDSQVVAADQLNDLDRALEESKPAAPAVKLASADTPPAPAAPVMANSNENSTWDQTSLIGKIFIGFGALLTMASAARMFMA